MVMLMVAKKQFETGCCPRFNPAPWQNKTHKWKNKMFVKGSLFSIFYIPLGINQFMMKNMELMNKARAKNPESICIMDYRSPFALNLYVATDKNVPGAQMTKMTGTYLTRVYEGDYKETGNWVKDMQAHVKGKGLALQKLMFSYTTCPSCAKAYGKNYVVAFAKV